MPSADGPDQNVYDITNNISSALGPAIPAKLDAQLNIPLIDCSDQEHDKFAANSCMTRSLEDGADLDQQNTYSANPVRLDVQADWSDQEQENFAENLCSARLPEETTDCPKQKLETYSENIDFASSWVKTVPDIKHLYPSLHPYSDKAGSSSVSEIILENVNENDICTSICTSNKSSTKWSSIKYSRPERERRRREASVSSEQTEVTKFFPIINKISETLSKNPDNLFLPRYSDNDPNANPNSPDTETKKTNYSNFLQDLLEHALRNSNPKKKNNFENNLKQFGIYIYYVGGRQLYETLHANLHNVLPCIRTLQKFTFQQRIGYEPGKINMSQLNTFLEKRNLKKVIWISEDCTRLTSTIEYDSTTNSWFFLSARKRSSHS